MIFRDTETRLIFHVINVILNHDWEYKKDKNIYVELIEVISSRNNGEIMKIRRYTA